MKKKIQYRALSRKKATHKNKNFLLNLIIKLVFLLFFFFLATMAIILIFSHSTQYSFRFNVHYFVLEIQNSIKMIVFLLTKIIDDNFKHKSLVK